MRNFSIYCTATQTKKALELGAPIFTFSESFADDYRTSIYDKYCSIPPIKYEEYEDAVYADIPTAEQMIGWLREKDLYVNIIHISTGYTSWIKTIKENITLSEENTGFVNSFEEATLAAIDKAMEYLMNNKK